MSADEIKKVLNSLRDLPAMPNVVTKALGAIKNPNSGAKDLAKIVAHDTAITVELLKIVNSAYFGLSQNIQTVHQAVTLLGFNEVKTIILACAMKPMMSTPGGKDIWEHAINTAVAAETISRKLGRSDYAECFAQGLMHDLGKMVFEVYNRQKMIESIILSKNSPNTLIAEKMVFGFDHTEVGYHIGTRWGLPKQIIAIMKHHHKPYLCEFKMSANIIYLADRLVQNPLREPLIEPEMEYKLGFEITNMEGFRKQVLEKAKLLLVALNTI